MKPNSQHPENLNDIVFENRNKNYGAYVIRTSYDERLSKAFLVALSFFVCVVLTPFIISLLKDQVEVTLKADGGFINGGVEIPMPKPDMPKPENNSTMKKSAGPAPIVVKNVLDTLDKKEDPNRNSNPNGDPNGKDTIGKPKGGGGGGIVLDTIKKKEDENKIELISAKMPQFPGGDEAMMKYLSKNIKYPTQASEMGITGNVVLTFVVDRSGKVTDIRALKKVGGGCTEEAIRVVEGMPQWEPGLNEKGKPVRVQFNLPVNFRLK